MLYKVFDIPAFDSHDNQRVIPLSGLEKLAAVEFDGKKKVGLSQTLQRKIRAIKPHPDYSYVVVIPIGAYEHWGPNSRGDAVLEDHLCPNEENNEIYKKRPYGYKTFLNGAVFAHHRNKPQKGHPRYGDIIYSGYYQPMHWIELLIRVYRGPLGKDYPNILRWIDDGQPFDVSMGLYCVADICSVCKNVRRRETDPSCIHISKQNIGRILEDGTVCCMINLFPKFHDISFVTAGADSLAHGLMKVASKSESVDAGVGASEISSAEIRRAINKITRKGLLPKGPAKIPSKKSNLKTILEKRSAIAKLLGLFSKEASIDPEILLNAGDRFGPGLILSLIRHKILLDPEEFSAAFLGSSGDLGKAKGTLLIRYRARIPYPTEIIPIEADLDYPHPITDKWVRDNLLKDRSVLLNVLQERLLSAAEHIIFTGEVLDQLKAESSDSQDWKTIEDPELENAYSRYLGMIMGSPDIPVEIRRETILPWASDLRLLGLEKVAALGTLMISPFATIPLWIIAKNIKRGGGVDPKMIELLMSLAERQKAPTIIVPPPMPDLRPTALPFELLESLRK